MSQQPVAKGSILSRAGGGMMLLIVGFACGGAIAVAPDIAAAVMVLQIPGAIALVVDQSPGRGIGKTISLCQGAASVHPIMGIWFQCSGVHDCVGMVTDRLTVAIILLAAAGGFLLAQALPLILKIIDDARTKFRCEHLSRERQKLVVEWGLDK